jgi:peptide/nickel transport system substrate-binding protein
MSARPCVGRWRACASLSSWRQHSPVQAVRASQRTAAHGNPWTIPGVLRWGEYAEPDTLNPMLSSLQVPVEISLLWAGYLFDWNDRNQFVPDLATEVPTTENGGISPDGKTITYHLRRGVRWQDGAPFGAEDVIFSWHSVMNPKNNVPNRQGYELISSIEKIDDFTIVVHLRRAYAPFTATFFTMSAFTYPVLPAHLLAKLDNINQAAFNTIPIGTGPFKVAEYRRGQYLKLVANPRYWRGPPKLKEIILTFVGDQNTLITQLRTHELDFATNLSLSLVPDLLDIPGTRVYGIPFTYFTYIGFNTGVAPLDDIRVRRALAFATDRRAIVANVTHGYALAADSDQPPFSWAHAPRLENASYDTTASTRLLDAAGWRMGRDGFRSKAGRRLDLVVVSTAGSTIYRSVEQMLQSQWKAAGVNLIVKNSPDSINYAPAADNGIFASGKFDLMVEGWFNGVDPDDSGMFTCNQASPIGDNYYRFCDPRVDAAERVALSSNREPTRRAAYATVQRVLVEDRPVIFLWFAKRVDVANSDLTGYRAAHAVTTLWNAWEWSI